MGAKIVWSGNLSVTSNKNTTSGSITCPVDFDYTEIYGDVSRFGYAPVIIPKNGSGYVSYAYNYGNNSTVGRAPISISNLTVTVSNIYFQSSGTNSGNGTFNGHIVFYKYTS